MYECIYVCMEMCICMYVCIIHNFHVVHEFLFIENRILKQCGSVY